MPLNNQSKNQHLLWRAAFGPMIEMADSIRNETPASLYSLLEKTSDKKPQNINVARPPMYDPRDGKLTQEQRRELRKQTVFDLRNLNLTWISEMVNSQAQLREKMSLFWHGHFACRNVNIRFQQQLLDIIRTHALGNFGDLLRAVSKAPAMLGFLNNQQNRKAQPNENFAREVMELFTMGIGNYSEQDVKEAARAFTGWGFDLNGQFVFRERLHDEGSKEFLGRKGNFDGDDVLSIILDNKATAIFITRKIYRFFVNEVVDETWLKSLADGFYQSNYDIQKLMRALFTSDHFYSEKNMGCRIKSPVELIVGVQRMLPMKLQNPEVLLLLQRSLGQFLFYPPNVAGWPGGNSWIDSSSLLLRMRLAQMLTASESFTIKPKDDDDIMMGFEGVDSVPTKNKLVVNVDWTQVVNAFKNINRAELLSAITKSVLQTKVSLSDERLGNYLNTNSRESFIKSAIVTLMSTPEYQLC